MDTSVTYVKMCEKAKEIQDNHEFQEADYLAGYLDNDKPYVVTFCDEYTPYEGKWTWLPRQDQLQEIGGVGKNFPCFLELYRWHSWALEIASGDYWDSFTSMEQLWLAFVMHEKYGKVWNGQDWVKEER